MTIPLAGDPNSAALMNLSPSANLGGGATGPVYAPGYGPTGLGGKTNPFLPTPTTGTSSLPSTSPISSFPANTGDSTLGPNPIISTGLGAGLGPGTPGGNAVWRGIMGQGISSGIASLIQQFLAGGAGYNPQVAQALIAQLQPQISRGQANIMEQFGSKGLADSSAAAIGLGDFESQVTLDEGAILANLYEQSVMNYMNVLMGVAKPKVPTFGSQFSGAFASSLGSGLGDFLTGG